MCLNNGFLRVMQVVRREEFFRFDYKACREEILDCLGWGSMRKFLRLGDINFSAAEKLLMNHAERRWTGSGLLMNFHLYFGY